MEDRLGIGPYHYHSNCCRQDAQQHVLINCAAHFSFFLVATFPMRRLERGFWGWLSANGILDEPRLLVLSFYITRPDTAAAGWGLHAWHRGCPFVFVATSPPTPVCVCIRHRVGPGGWQGRSAGGGNTGAAGWRSIGDGLRNVGRSGPVCGFPFSAAMGGSGRTWGWSMRGAWNVLSRHGRSSGAPGPRGSRRSGLCVFGLRLGSSGWGGTGTHKVWTADGRRWVQLSAQVSSSSTTMESATWNNSRARFLCVSLWLLWLLSPGVFDDGYILLL